MSGWEEMTGMGWVDIDLKVEYYHNIIINYKSIIFDNNYGLTLVEYYDDVAEYEELIRMKRLINDAAIFILTCKMSL